MEQSSSILTMMSSGGKPIELPRFARCKRVNGIASIPVSLGQAAIQQTLTLIIQSLNVYSIVSSGTPQL